MARPSTDLGAPVPARILDESRKARRLAVSALIPDRACAAFALRSVMVRDDDAEIRARAAARLRAVPRRPGGSAVERLGHVDTCMMVVSTNNARRETVVRAKKLLTTAQVDVAGVVVNGLETTRRHYYYYYYYYDDGSQGRRKWYHF